MDNYRSPFAYLPDEHMRLVGIIAFHWETVDLTMQRAIAEVMNHTIVSVGLLTDNLSFRAKQDLMMSFARPLKERDPQLWQDFTQVLESVKKANTLRNTYVHAKWQEGPSPDLPKRTAAHVRGGRFVLVDDPTPKAELESAAQKIFEAGAKLTEFFQRFDLLKS